MTEIKEDEEFWRLDDVVKKSGLSKSEIYRRIKAGLFPEPRHYRNSSRSFWLRSEFLEWQMLELVG